MYSQKHNNQEQSNYKFMVDQAIQLAIKGDWDAVSYTHLTLPTTPYV